MSSAASLPYTEPSIITVLVLSSFLLLLNVINSVLDRLIYCGLIGQLLLGVAYGTPGAGWISIETENVISQLGYLGLILLVYEGGLSTSIDAVRANLFLSIAVAITGISLPIALSFVLRSLANATPLQAFAAGAALCSTSLGTTLTVLSTSGLQKSRLGVVLTSAAMTDDVVGLVMVQVISNLGPQSGQTFGGVQVIRPVLVSLAFAVVVPFVCWAVVRPITFKYASMKSGIVTAAGTERAIQTAFVLQTLILLAFVTAGTYAGTSNLLTAYLAGATISWWDSLEIDIHKRTINTEQVASTLSGTETAPSTHIGSNDRSSRLNSASGLAFYDKYYEQATTRILKPFFFASIGSSVPISKMFSGAVVWRGFVYAVLMILGKLMCGLWLIRLNIPLPAPRTWRITKVFHKIIQSTKSSSRRPVAAKARRSNILNRASNKTESTELASMRSPPETAAPNTKSMGTAQPSESLITSTQPVKPLTLYPATILGGAMVARGEIGFLISSLANSQGLFSANSSDGSSSQDENSSIFLVVTWAIVLCTIIGPVTVGLLVRRLKALEKRAQAGASVEGVKRNVLGSWGVE